MRTWPLSRMARCCSVSCQVEATSAANETGAGSPATWRDRRSVCGAAGGGGGARRHAWKAGAPPLDRRVLVALLVVDDAVHEGADQQQAAAAGLAEVGGVGRVRQRRRVEALALVADDEHALVAAQPGRHVH